MLARRRFSLEYLWMRYISLRAFFLDLAGLATSFEKRRVKARGFSSLPLIPAGAAMNPWPSMWPRLSSRGLASQISANDCVISYEKELKNSYQCTYVNEYQGVVNITEWNLTSHNWGYCSDNVNFLVVWQLEFNFRKTRQNSGPGKRYSAITVVSRLPWQVF